MSWEVRKRSEATRITHLRLYRQRKFVQKRRSTAVGVNVLRSWEKSGVGGSILHGASCGGETQGERHAQPQIHPFSVDCLLSYSLKLQAVIELLAPPPLVPS